MDSYEDILKRMIEEYERLSGFTLCNESDIMLRLRVLAGELYNTACAIQYAKCQMFVSTAESDYLDKHAYERGLERKPSVKSSGEVTFRLSQPSDTDIVIPVGTVVATSSPDVREFVTTQAVTLSAGLLVVRAPVEALNAGAAYNVRDNTVTVMVTPPRGVSYVTNERAIKGGVDLESDRDLRQRIIDSYKDISNSTNAVYYKRLAESVTGVYSASVVSRARGAGTIDIHICGKEDSKVGPNELQAVQTLIDENREFNVDVLVLYAELVSVNFTLELEVEDGYSFETVSQQVADKLSAHVNSLGVGEPALLCDLGDLIYHTQGVKNYEFMDAFCSDVYAQPDMYLRAGKIDIRQVTR